MSLNTPHIPLGISSEEGLKILPAISSEVHLLKENSQNFYQIKFGIWECGFYEEEGHVVSTWYNDPQGRESSDGINLKVTQYLERYGSLSNWESGINNGWIQFFLNQTDHVSMAYGLHKDVVRFNKIS
jgi:hypothetical protein